MTKAATGYVGQRFTVDNLSDDVDVSWRTVQRALKELAELGHLDRRDDGTKRELVLG
ncbi:GntR family transcriptional regulator [Haloplanus pelagicus]|uniref:GntR family transcriptional regulator n=1 Tax=Haloplanus pelagicus TaxID=2949995 RepID=UPI00203EF35C|nr:GntR family transcriptional regulator [Haloplanus sp. HW8-1]